MNRLNQLRGRRYYKFVLWCVVLLCMIMILWQGSVIVTSPKWLKIDDYVEYWAAGRLNMDNGNPYSPDQLLPIQQDIGRYFGVPVMMWNPPWMLTLVMPFSIFEYSISRILWSIFMTIVVFISSSVAWKIYQGIPEKKWIPWILAFTFIPILEAFRTGQTGPLLLLGVIGFIFFIDKEKPLLAGMSLSLIAIKPHILYLFIIAVFFWCVKERNLKVIIGALLSLSIATLISFFVNPSVVEQYLYAAIHYPPDDWATPTIGGFLRLLLGTEKFWLQFIAPFFGIVWFIIIWLRKQNNWNWPQEIPLLVLVSIFSAPYGWTSDQSVSIIPIIQICIILMPIKFTRNSLLVITFYLIIEILLIIPWGNQILFWWLAPALLGWYSLSKRVINKSPY